MKKLTHHCRTACLASLALIAGSIAIPETARAADANTFAPPGNLTAALVDNAHIDLAWKNNATESGGCFIEFNMNPDEEFSLLDIVWSDTPSFRHPDVARETRFSYRIKPFFGRASDQVEVTTGTESPADTPRFEADGPLPESAPAANGDAAVKKSIKTAQTIAEAAPAELSASLASPTTVDLRWEDRAADEDGYLVEISLDRKEFKICALLPPDANSFRKTQLPSEARCSFRVRAFFRGESSAIASVSTPATGLPLATTEAKISN